MVVVLVLELAPLRPAWDLASRRCRNKMSLRQGSEGWNHTEDPIELHLLPAVALSTIRALKGPFLGVRSHMALEVLSFGKHALANRALASQPGSPDSIGPLKRHGFDRQRQQPSMGF